MYAGFANLRGYSSAINSVLETCELKISKSYLKPNKGIIVLKTIFLLIILILVLMKIIKKLLKK